MVQRGIDGAAIITDPYPDNDRSEWVVAPLTIVRRRARMLVGSVEFYADQASKDAGGLPFLIDSFRYQIRANTPEGEHQRIQKDSLGRMLHASGEHVAPEDVEDFLTLRSTIQWQENEGLLLPPWMFPNYDGVLEGLDPQWLRKRFSLLVATQVDGNIDRYSRGVFDRRLDGDHRGTTFDLQVGAGADDGNTIYRPVSNNPGTPLVINITNNRIDVGSKPGGGGDSVNAFHRFTGVSGFSGATIDVADFSLFGQLVEDGTPETLISADDSLSPATYTTKEEHDGAARTTAGVTWDDLNLSTSAFTASPSIVTVYQELADSFDTLTIVILHDDDLKTATLNVANSASYENDTTEAAKTHIELTAPSGIVVLRRRIEGY